ncbi:MAG: hypothetical protein ISS93_01880 [Candidatus Aenigmarchaeota archaeon]|nr:hypothetical protein [Candidatus Aenigmarchaeota archaeon]
MARKRRGTLSRKERKTLRERREMEGELEQGKKATVRSLQHLYGFSEEDVDKYFELVNAEPKWDIIRATRKLMTNIDKGYIKTVGAFEEVLGLYEKWVDEVRASPLAQKVLGTRLDSDTIDKAFFDVESPPEDVEHVEIPGHYDLHHVTVDFYHDMDRFEDGSLNHLRDFGKKLKALFEEGDPAVTRQYVDDFVEELKDDVVECLSGFYKIISPNHLIVREPEYYRVVMERMESVKASYLSLKGKEGVRILSLIPPDGMSRQGVVKRVGKQVCSLEERGANLRLVGNLLATTEEDCRWDLFDTISERPHIVSLYKTLRKEQVSLGEYAKFLLEEGDLKWIHKNETILDTVQHVATQPSQRKAAVFFLRYGAELLFDNQIDELIDVASTYHLSDIVLEEYTAATKAKESNRASAMLAVGKAQLPAGQMRLLRMVLRGVREEELEWVKGCSSEEIVKQLEHSQKAAQTKKSVPITREQVDWYTTMFNSMEALGMPETTRRNVRESYEMLPSPLQGRLRNIWINQRDSLEEFCKDVAEFGETEAYQLILKNRTFFAAYKEQLRSNSGFSKELRKLAVSGSPNVYRDLGKLLQEDVDYPEHLEEVKDAGTLEPTELYGRVVIWGGQYSREAKEKISSAIDVPIEVYDIYNRRKDVKGITDDDVVICVTTSMSHDQYYYLKGYCREHGIGFYHFNRAGQNPLIQFLQEKFSSAA